MGRFFKNVLSSCLGTVLFLIVLLGLFMIIGLASGDKPSYKSKSVLELDLNALIPEKSGNINKFEELMDMKEKLGMDDILKLIERAKTDDKIKGILIKSEYPQVGMAKALSIRESIKDFKETGKFVYAYGNSFSQLGYYIASAADSVFLNPNGMLDLKGLGISMPYFKDMMDELGIKWNIYYAGQFKSATEPFRRNDMSDQNRQQLREYIGEVFDNMLLEIAQSRQISVETVDNFTHEYAGMEAKNTVDQGLIDKLIYDDELKSLIRDQLGIKEKKKISFVDLGKYKRASEAAKSSKSKDKIAVVYAEGDIVGSGKEKGIISSAKYIETLAKIRNRDNIKAVILRINSPGGSGFASDEIWREVELLKEKGIPVIASMSDYAASGGYYIACNADSIVASPNTLTGSIGVFAMIPNLKKLSNEKLKIHFDSVKTHQFANAFDPFYEYSDQEHAKIQSNIDMFYEKFLSRVSEGRNMSRDDVHAVAQGRIWTGRKAKEIGLVDELGNLENAIEIGAEKAGLDDYKVVSYPKFKKNMFEEVIKNMDMEARFISGLEDSKAIQEIKPYADIFLNEKNYGKAQMLLPVKVDFD